MLIVLSCWGQLACCREGKGLLPAAAPGASDCRMIKKAQITAGLSSTFHRIVIWHHPMIEARDKGLKHQEYIIKCSSSSTTYLLGELAFTKA
jgi:hypothetical protein